MNYQKIDIDGFYSEGIDRTKDYYQIFKDKPIGLSILDIGCNNGFYSLKAINEGANRAIGIDKADVFLQIGKDAKKFIGYDNINFIHGDIMEDGLPDDNFDIVLCLNILHYFTIEQVKKILDMIDERCNKMMVFEILHCDNGEWKIVVRPNTTVISLSENIFFERFKNYEVECFDSLVTDGRKIIKVIK